ncbi:Choline transport ATP-binding protein OpuBA [Holospora curviuscula]|uniref:Choline transport ATP-binding protein OpuBA n=2 Tax=Holospora curviuscula TaxID=1082868 RepID=A0A2S5RE13_9PROT|nr:Choline transport ATP-binding protein OpuBA [Holospora curviuscula]
MLRLEHVTVTLGKGTPLERKVLNGLNVQVKEGEFLVVVGSNGAGKSTLFNLISGAITPDSGKIYILGKDVTFSTPMERSRLVSMVVQDPKAGTIAQMTIFENMAFALKRGQKRGLKRFFTPYRWTLCKEKCSILGIGLEHRLKEFVGNLSGGQRQGLSLLMAIAQDSSILLLDEITAALDPINSDRIMELTAKIVTQYQRTCIMITHNMAQAIRYGDRVLVLKNGTFVKEYTAAEKSKLPPYDRAFWEFL